MGYHILRISMIVNLLAFIFACPGQAQPVPSPKSSAQQTATDSKQVNNHTIRFEGYFKRYPYARMAEQFTKRETFNEHGKYPVLIGPPTQAGDGSSLGETITIPPGDITMKKASKGQNGDTKVHFRPQYRAIFKPCGGDPGYFLPQPGSLPPSQEPNSRRGQIPPNLQAVPIIFSSSTIPQTYEHPVYVRPTSGFETPCYVQPWIAHNNRSAIGQSTSGIAQARDEELWEYELTTFGVGPISDTQFQMIDRQDNQRFLELLFDPERWIWMTRASANMQRQQMSESVAEGAENTFQTAVLTMNESLINVANENAAQPVAGGAAEKTIPQAIYMVQQMYKYVFIPMSILFLLPGAILTQMKGMVASGMLRNASDEDTVSPFSGILRSTIAIFLIPATQLAVSYLIDVGNSLTYEVQKYVEIEQLFKHTNQQTFNAPRDNARNVMLPSIYQDHSNEAKQREQRGDGNPTLQDEQNGAAYEIPEEDSEVEKQTNLSMILQLAFNSLDYLMSQALIVLTGFQLVMMCYLFLLGPIAACLFAWPASIGRELFRRVFANWIDAVTILSLWRFWWMVVLACMSTRIAWLKEIGAYTPNTQWEMMMFTCFLGLLMYVPFQPFEFRPGEVATRALEQGARAVRGLSGQAAQAAKEQGMPAQQVDQAKQELNKVADMASMTSRGMSEQGTGLFPDVMPPSANPYTQYMRDQDKAMRNRIFGPDNNSAAPNSPNSPNAPNNGNPDIAPPPGEPVVMAPQNKRVFPSGNSQINSPSIDVPTSSPQIVSNNVSPKHPSSDKPPIA
jgi:hypothetical protein